MESRDTEAYKYITCYFVDMYYKFLYERTTTLTKTRTEYLTLINKYTEVIKHFNGEVNKHTKSKDEIFLNIFQYFKHYRHIYTFDNSIEQFSIHFLLLFVPRQTFDKMTMNQRTLCLHALIRSLTEMTTNLFLDPEITKSLIIFRSNNKEFIVSIVGQLYTHVIAFRDQSFSKFTQTVDNADIAQKYIREIAKLKEDLAFACNLAKTYAAILSQHGLLPNSAANNVLQVDRPNNILSNNMPDNNLTSGDAIEAAIDEISTDDNSEISISDDE